MAKGFEINDDFITYCNGKNCDAQKLLDEIINKEMNPQEEKKEPPAPQERKEEPPESNDLNRLIALGMK